MDWYKKLRNLSPTANQRTVNLFKSIIYLMVHSKICEFWLSLRLGLPYKSISATVWSESSCKLYTVSSSLSNKVALIGM